MPPTWIVLLGLVTTSHADAMEGFIVGGFFATIDQNAYSAFLNINCAEEDGQSSGWICGASVVNQKILLTAGHCLYGCTYASNIGVKLGNENRQRGQSHTARSFVVHEHYNTKTSANDICLLRTSNNVNLNKKVNRVALMKSPPYNEAAKVAGWGMIDEIRERQGDRLKFTSQKVLSRTACKDIFRYLSDGTICAKGNDSSTYASQGDSGSALTVRGYIQIGLVSYKIPGIARHIVVYTDVGHYYDWIKAYSRYLTCKVG